MIDPDTSNLLHLRSQMAIIYDIPMNDIEILNHMSTLFFIDSDSLPRNTICAVTISPFSLYFIKFSVCRHGSRRVGLKHD